MGLSSLVSTAPMADGRGLRHSPRVIDELRAAADALSAGDPVPFAALFADDAEWRGVASGHLWWKRTPS